MTAEDDDEEFKIVDNDEGDAYEYSNRHAKISSEFKFVQNIFFFFFALILFLNHTEQEVEQLTKQAQEITAGIETKSECFCV